MTGKALKQRVSVSLDQKTYADLSAVADENGVSISWVIRYAVQNLFRERKTVKHQQLILPFSNTDNSN